MTVATHPHPRPRQRSRRAPLGALPTRVPARAALVLVLTAAATCLAACSAAPGPAPSSGPTVASAATWGACMRAAGVDIPDPSPEMHAKGMYADPGDVDEQVVEEALRTCEDGARGDAAAVDEQQAAFEAAWEEYAACMAAHGVEGMDDSAGDVDGAVPDGSSDPDWAAASEACGPTVSEFMVTP